MPADEPAPPKQSNDDIAKYALQYEWEAIGQYTTLKESATDPALLEILEHNRRDEIGHANSLLDWLNHTQPYVLENMQIRNRLKEAGLVHD